METSRYPFHLSHHSNNAHPTDLSFYHSNSQQQEQQSQQQQEQNSSKDLPTSLGIFPPTSIGFSHTPISLVPNPSSNPLLNPQAAAAARAAAAAEAARQAAAHQSLQQHSPTYETKPFIKEENVDEDLLRSEEPRIGRRASKSPTRAQALQNPKISIDALGKRVYSCTLCDFQTKQKGFLKVHINSVHYKMKVFNCDLCKFTSIQKGNLRAHVLTVHEKQRNFPCDFCEYRAGTKGILKTHIKNRHLRLEKDTYDCTLCPFKATKKSHLKNHINNEHR